MLAIAFRCFTKRRLLSPPPSTHLLHYSAASFILIRFQCYCCCCCPLVHNARTIKDFLIPSQIQMHPLPTCNPAEYAVKIGLKKICKVTPVVPVSKMYLLLNVPKVSQKCPRLCPNSISTFLNIEKNVAQLGKKIPSLITKYVPKMYQMSQH